MYSNEIIRCSICGAVVDTVDECPVCKNIIKKENIKSSNGGKDVNNKN